MLFCDLIMNISTYVTAVYEHQHILVHRIVQPVFEDIEADGASIHSMKVRLILCLAQILFQIQITLKNVIEIQNTF